MNNIKKEVFFGAYCPICKHSEEPEASDVCAECLKYPSNDFSHKPVNFEKNGYFKNISKGSTQAKS